MGKKTKSIDQVKEEKRKNKKNSANKRKKYYARTITEYDFLEVKKQFPYIEKDSRGIYYINAEGEREDIHFPYLPIPDDDSSKLILYRETMNQTKGKFLFQIIDNTKKVIDILEKGRKPIEWKLAPNRNVSAMKRGQEYKIYSISKGTKLLPTKVLNITKASDTKLHKVIMSLVFPNEMQEYRKENDKKPGNRQIDHISGNELDCRIRNMWITDKQQNLRGKAKIDMQMLLDRTCIYYKKDADNNYLYDSQKFVLVLKLGDYTKEEWEKLGKGEKIIKDNRINGQSQYNFIEYKGAKGNIIVAIFSNFKVMNKVYQDLIFVADGEKAENVEQRNKKIFDFFSNYLNQDAEKVEGLEKVILLADTSEVIENGKSYVFFDNITTGEQNFLKARKRGFIIRKEQDEETGKEICVLKNIANQKVTSDTIIDILYPYFDKIIGR